MAPGRWQQISDLYHAALIRPRDDRAAFLAEASGGDDALRREVESLLSQSESAQAFLDAPAVAHAARLVSSVEPPAIPVGHRLGAYQILAPLGAGGMGEVYRARDTKLGRDVAIKVLPRLFTNDTDRLARFEREARMLAALNHPHIAQIYGVEDNDGAHALVMELVEGPTLADLIRGAATGERRALPVNDALAIARQMSEALEAAHDRGIVHRDLKPANVKVRADGAVKVLDFGLAKSVAGERDALPTLTAISVSGAIVGTPAYMSPEQARGEITGRETDIWSFGIVLYEMLTGLSPFARPTSTEALAQVLTASVDESRLPPDTPEAVRRVIRRCLEKDSRRRWRNIGDVRIAIEDTIASPPAAAAAAEAPRSASISRRKMIVSSAIAGGGLLAGGAAGGVLLDRRSRPAATAASFRRLTFRRGLIRSARFAPDGETILYGALWDDEFCRVHTVRVDGPESRPLDLPHGNLLAVSRSGELALALGRHEDGTITYGTLASVSLAGGAPRRIVEDVKFADWSTSGDLAIVRRVDGRDRLEFPIGNVLLAPAVGQDTGIGFPRLSPDGRHVAIVRYRAPASLVGRIELVDRSGAVTSLSGDSLNIHGLTWRGGEIVYTAADDRPLFRSALAVRPGGTSRVLTRMATNLTVWDAGPDGRLVMAQTDDRSVTIVRDDTGGERDLSWLDASRVDDLSKDGRWLLLSEIGMGGGQTGSVYLRGTDGSDAVRLGAGFARSLSPDGKWAACIPVSPSPVVELLPTGAGDARRLQDAGFEYLMARWLPDGKRLLVSARQGGRPWRMYLRAVETAGLTAVTPEGVLAGTVDPDGTAVAATVVGAPMRVYPFDGSPARDISGLTGTEVPVGWITDGLLVVRLGDPDAPLGQIYKVDLATGRQVAWKSILPRDRAGIMNQTSFRTTPDGRRQAYTWHRALSNLYVADGLA